MPITERGFSLIELIVVMVVLGILAGLTALFITKPVTAYLAVQRRAELVDIADTALQRIARDVRLALPNSVRVVSASGTVGSCSGSEACYLEFLPVKDGGRYRAEQSSVAACASSPDAAAAGCNILDFSAGTDTGFDVLGPAPSAANNDYLVIYNLGVDADSDAWQGGNRRTVSAGNASSVSFGANGTRLPYESPARRYFITGRPVTYVCNPAAHSLQRYAGYAPQPAQPATAGAAPLNVAPALLASRVQACSFKYDGGASQRLGQLTLRIQLRNADGDNVEDINLYREVAVNNEP